MLGTLDLQVAELKKQQDRQHDTLEAVLVQIQLLKKRIDKLIEQQEMMQLEIDAIEHVIDEK